jgi:hypothetical protein
MVHLADLVISSTPEYSRYRSSAMDRRLNNNVLFKSRVP